MLNLHKKLLGEVPSTYNGGGKSGGGKIATPSPVTTKTVVGDKLSAQGKTFNMAEEEGKIASVKKASKGTRGLQIPLADSMKAANTGVQL